MAAEPTPAGGTPVVLPEPVRHRVVALAAQALSDLEPRQLPAPLRKVAQFTPSRRARLAGAMIASALETDEGFRDRIAALVRAGHEDLVEAIAADAVATIDPTEVAAIAYLTRGEGWQHAFDAALDAVEAERAASAASAAEESDTNERLRAAADQLREELRSARATHRREIDALKRDNTDLRRKLGDARTRARTAEEERDAAAAELESATERERQRASESDAEIRRLRQRLEAAVADLGDQRRQARDERAQESVRARLLLDTVIDGAQGLRRELALPPAETLPADTVGGDESAARGAGYATVGDPSRLRSLLELPRVHLVVDGYNVSKSAWGDSPLDRQRTRLVSELAGVAARTSAEVTVVFDGAEVAASPPSARGVRVRFSPAGVTADDVIARLVSAEPTGRPIVVVSNDAEIASHARREGARPATSQALVALMSGR